MAGSGVGGEVGGWAWRCGRPRPRLPGPPNPPPPRDYLVSAAAMSPGRNVPPQIMLFISLGGSAARQHQAPGGRCARSPALPFSPCAAAAPGVGLAAATAPTQVSPGRARRPEGGGCRSGCARMGRAARARRTSWTQGVLDARVSGDSVGTQPGMSAVGAARGPRGPGGCGSEHPGARESAWASRGAWRARRLLWRGRSWSVARGTQGGR